MDWNTPRNQKQLVEYLEANGYLTDPRVKDVLLQVDRGVYCKGLPYVDTIKDIGYCAFVEAPHMLAYALEKLRDQLVEGGRALDVGAGSGYLTVCMAMMVGQNGRVVGLEHMAELVTSAENSARNDRPEFFRNRRLKFENLDGRKGYFKESPYNAIYVGAAATEVPQELVDQLAPGGRMLIPVGPRDAPQTMVIVDKEVDGRVVETQDVSVRTMNLTDIKQQLGPYLPKREMIYRKNT